MYTTVITYLLRHKLNFGQTRIIRFLDDIKDLMDSVVKGYVTLKDLENVLVEETGVDIKARIGG